MIWLCQIRYFRLKLSLKLQAETMKNFTIILLLLSTFAYGQSDTLVMESVTYDTLITISVVKKIAVEKTVDGREISNTKKEEMVASEELLFKDKKAPRKSERRIAAKSGLGLGVSVVSREDEDVIVPEAPKMGDYYFPVIDEPSRFAYTIKADDLKKHAMILASDEYEGRETGKAGQRKAAEYIANHFKTLGLPNLGEEQTYFQTYPLKGETWEVDGIKIKVNGQQYKYLEDFYAFPSTNRSRSKLDSKEVIFLGYGIDDPAYSDYEGQDVNGKIVMVYPGEPQNENGIFYINGNQKASEWTTNWRAKLQAARKHGVKTLLLIEPNVRIKATQSMYQLTEANLVLDNNSARKYANSCYISTDIARAIMGKKFEKVTKARDKMRETGKPQAIKLKTKIVIRQKKNRVDVLAENVLGFIRGSDPEVNDEMVVITAHYDHLGKRGKEVFNGADDNGSGTSAVLDIAEAFAKAAETGAQPRRSILVMAVSGEEKGLLGSEYYANNPVFPIEKTVANLNVDMIGRVDENHLNPNYVYVIGADRISTELDAINKAMNEKYTKIDLDYKFNEKDDPNRFYYRSDHYSFAEKGVPAAFFFSGVHSDYHQTTDTPDKLDYKKMERIARLVFMTAWEIAEREARIVSDVPQK